MRRSFLIRICFIPVRVTVDAESITAVHHAYTLTHSFILSGNFVYPIHLPACFLIARANQRITALNGKEIEFIETRHANKLYTALDLSHKQHRTSKPNEHAIST